MTLAELRDQGRPTDCCDGRPEREQQHELRRGPLGQAAGDGERDATETARDEDGATLAQREGASSTGGFERRTSAT